MMEERKVSIEVHKKSFVGQVQKMDSGAHIDFARADDEVSRVLGEGVNDNWYELRFPSAGPDRRGYHSSFMHNKR